MTVSGPAEMAGASVDVGAVPARQAPVVSVIVPVYNDEAGLAMCLQALEEQTYPGDRYEVVVVDNGSARPVSPMLAAYAHAVAASEAAPGSYAARNRGIVASRGQVLAFTDADCRPAPDWLASGVAALEEHTGCGLVAGAIQVTPRDAGAPTAVELYELTYGFRQSFYVSEGFGATANLFARRAVIDAVGPFDARLRSCGDREWGNRVRDAGYTLIYDGKARVYHPARRTWGELIRKTARVSGGMFTLSRLQGKGRRYSLSVAASELRPPIRHALGLLGDDGPPGLRAKLGVIAALTVRRWVTAFEWLRLEAGSLPKR